jgi:glyoxylase-like metal-dependent hydrolase (beta-lactamase superfamily II)
VEASRAYAINPKVNGLPLPFPKKLTSTEDNIWMLGHHSDKSFGAIPYLVQGKHGDNGQVISVMVDVPKFTKSAIRAVEEVLEHTSGEGPDYMFLTHVDDTAQHNEWSEYFPNMKRIFHAGDLGEYNWIGDETLNNVEVLLHDQSNVEEMKLAVMSLDGSLHKEISCSSDSDVAGILSAVFREWSTEFLIFHTPGHSPGSISLFYKSNVGTIFTGDTYAYTTRNGGHMTGFPRYGNDLSIQRKTLECIKNLSSQYSFVASGHGHPRNYSEIENDHSVESSIEALKESDIDDALLELRTLKM